MSKRFGRNQRRALRAALETERDLRLTGCARAPTGTLEIEALGVLSWDLSIDQDRGRFDRRATVLIEKGTLLIRHYRDARRVAFQGGLYAIHEISYSEMNDTGFFGHRTWRGGPDAYQIVLRGVGL